MSRKLIAILLFTLAMVSCGSTPTLNVDIEIASNSANSMATLKAQYDTGQSKGLYFRFTPLKPCPSSINDVDPTAEPFLPADPTKEELGADPSKSQFVVNTTKLSQDRVYAVRILAFSSTGEATHYGDATCPMSTKYPDLNPLVVCFGLAANPGICAGIPSFASCNLTLEQAQNCN